MLKPDISAPGSDVGSASNQSPACYGTLSHARVPMHSLSCPHVVASVAAILLSRNSKLTLAEVKHYISAGADADQKTLALTGNYCDGIAEDVYPNLTMLMVLESQCQEFPHISHPSVKAKVTLLFIYIEYLLFLTFLFCNFLYGLVKNPLIFTNFIFYSYQFLYLNLS